MIHFLSNSSTIIDQARKVKIWSQALLVPVVMYIIIHGTSHQEPLGLIVFYFMIAQHMGLYARGQVQLLILLNYTHSPCT